ncbi:hypothetical protein ACFLS9_02355 [Bacteroidota bacterium]
MSKEQDITERINDYKKSKTPWIRELWLLFESYYHNNFMMLLEDYNLSDKSQNKLKVGIFRLLKYHVESDVYLSGKKTIFDILENKNNDYRIHREYFREEHIYDVFEPFINLILLVDKEFQKLSEKNRRRSDAQRLSEDSEKLRIYKDIIVTYINDTKLSLYKTIQIIVKKYPKEDEPILRRTFDKWCMDKENQKKYVLIRVFYIRRWERKQLRKPLSHYLHFIRY